ncbi:MAG: T9SS type A sorting domain-containing protein [Paludibacteraceae bacterium]|nr:T9SS type A sorting domain-containing protein [Paludibacteraceae bacterium]
MRSKYPNPFNTTTTIGYYLPTTISNASIYVYDMNGTQLKRYPITERGKGNVIIQGSEFVAGMYLYALIADGKVIDTKRMIFNKITLVL